MHSTDSTDSPSADAGSSGTEAASASLTLFLAGDVMTGRGVDQILAHSVDPELHEPYVKSATTYVKLAEAVHGPIPDAVTADYVWGDALDELGRVQPEARIVNLETAITSSGDWWRDKGIHYRMHPGNVTVLTAARLDVCVLANNHVLDWGYAGLRETLAVLTAAGVQAVGAGSDAASAAAPAMLETGVGRLLVFAYGTPGAGVPVGWAARENQPGVNVLPNLGREQAQQVIDTLLGFRRPHDRVVVSLHWGGNWGYRVSRQERNFAHRLVDAGAADVIYGHSSHHPKGIEVYRNRPIFYGIGDFLNDYEGIGGQERYRPDLTLMAFPRLGASGALVSLALAPMRLRRFRLHRASEGEVRWLARTLDRESRKLGTRIEETGDGRLAVRWDTGWKGAEAGVRSGG